MVLREVEIDRTFEAFRAELIDDGNLISIEVDDGSTSGQPKIFLYFLEVPDSPISRFHVLERDSEVIRVPVFAMQGEPIYADVGKAEEIEKALSFSLPSSYAGMGGTQIVHSDG